MDKLNINLILSAWQNKTETSVDPEESYTDEIAHKEPFHQDLHCLQFWV